MKSFSPTINLKYYKSEEVKGCALSNTELKPLVLSLPKKSMVLIPDRPEMTPSMARGRIATSTIL